MPTAVIDTRTDDERATQLGRAPDPEFQRMPLDEDKMSRLAAVSAHQVGKVLLYEHTDDAGEVDQIFAKISPAAFIDAVDVVEVLSILEPYIPQLVAVGVSTPDSMNIPTTLKGNDRLDAYRAAKYTAILETLGRMSREVPMRRVLAVVQRSVDIDLNGLGVPAWAAAACIGSWIKLTFDTETNGPFVKHLLMLLPQQVRETYTAVAKFGSLLLLDVRDALEKAGGLGPVIGQWIKEQTPLGRTPDNNTPEPEPEPKKQDEERPSPNASSMDLDEPQAS